MAAKRIRFGIVFEGSLPSLEGGMFLNGLGIVEAEGCNKDGTHFMMLTVGKPRRTSEVEQAIEAFNGAASAGAAIRLVSFQGGPSVVTFERGHKFQLHPIYQTIRSANDAGNAAYWAWGSVEGRKRKRVINELESDLVESAILPTASKRASGAKESSSDAQVIRPSESDFLSIGCCGLLCIGMNSWSISFCLPFL